MLEQQPRFIKNASALCLLLSFSTVASALHYWKFAPIPFRKFSIHEGDILELIMSLSVMAIFMERAVEAILVPIRTPDRQQIEQEIGLLRVATADKNHPNTHQLQRLQEKEYELDVYRLNTARYAYWLSFVLGMTVSLVGIRALSGLVEMNKLSELSHMQKTLFALVDIVITGGVIAGGSAAIDKMGRKISQTLQLTSATTSIVTTPQQPQNNNPAAADSATPATTNSNVI
ncbi:MAG: hypothetical protein ACTFAK_06155 [Candidatus Electronema sp. VV]